LQKAHNGAGGNAATRLPAVFHFGQAANRNEESSRNLPNTQENMENHAEKRAYLIHYVDDTQKVATPPPWVLIFWLLAGRN
jgi:hypothetical protein